MIGLRAATTPDALTATSPWTALAVETPRQAVEAPNRDHQSAALAAAPDPGVAPAPDPAGHPAPDPAPDGVPEGGGPRRGARATSGTAAPSPARSGGARRARSGAVRADDATLAALVRQARAEHARGVRAGAGQRAVRDLLRSAGLAASHARVRAALASEPDPSTPPPDLAPPTDPPSGPETSPETTPGVLAAAGPTP